MPDANRPTDRIFTRRRLLQVAGGTSAVVGLGAGRSAADDPPADAPGDRDCPEATLEPEMVHYDDSIHEVCSDDHPKTETLQATVTEALEEEYPTVGSLIDAGFVPYLDFFSEGSWAHWLNPSFLGDDTTLDPLRPESILVDNDWWRPIGVMFVATDGGERVDPPPTIYVEEGDDGEEENESEDGEDEDGSDDGEDGDAGDACVPWHAHVGFPGRYAWWKYRQIYADGGEIPCRTPWMAHVWRYSHPESVYAHGAPDERGGPPAEDPGFDTDADPDEETLAPRHLPDAVLDEVEDHLW